MNPDVLDVCRIVIEYNNAYSYYKFKKIMLRVNKIIDISGN